MEFFMRFIAVYDIGAVNKYEHAEIVYAQSKEAANDYIVQKSLKYFEGKNKDSGISCNIYDFPAETDHSSPDAFQKICKGSLSSQAILMLKYQLMEHKEARSVWKNLSEISVNENDEIETDFMKFKAGTSKFDIWKWIESFYDISVTEELINK